MQLITFLYSYIVNLHRDTKGASAIEYAIIAGLIAVGLIAALTLLGGGLSDFFDSINNQLNLSEDT